MKVILNIEAVRFPLTGIGRYTYELASTLRLLDGVDDLKLFSATRFLSELPQPGCKSTSGHGVKRFVQQSKLAMEAYRLLMPLLRGRALRNSDDYLYHSPNFFLPSFPGKTVATFHDLSPFSWADCHDPVKVRYLQKELRRTLDTADFLITDSEFTRRELADFSGISIDRIRAVPLACSPQFRPFTEKEIQAVLQKYNLAYQGYSLFVGTIEPRKNILGLLQAYEQMPLKTRLRWPLVISGYRGWKSDDIHARINSAENEGWVRYFGFVPATDLPELYAGSRLFAFPSHYEGFGLPVLEAMSSGVPVVCSDSSSLPEVSGGAALTCSPNDIDGLSENLYKGLEDSYWRENAIRNGMSHAATFSWERCARETLDVYQKVTGD